MPALDSPIGEILPARVSPAGSVAKAFQTVCAWSLLALVDVALKLAGFDRFYRMMRRWPTVGAVATAMRAEVTWRTCAAIDRARPYYFKRAWCLQSAAAAVCFLRLRGIRADLVIGVRKVPFYAHAWAEVDGVVVNNAHPSLQPHLREITRC